MSKATHRMREISATHYGIVYANICDDELDGVLFP